jgi:hypothetical protein
MKNNSGRSIGALVIVLLFLLSAFTSPIGSQSLNQVVVHSDPGLQGSQNSTPNGESHGNDTYSISDQAYNTSQSPQPLDVSDPWWNTSWMYRKEITIDHTKVAGDLTNFPVLISFSADADLVGKTQTNGDDLVFTNKTGTKLSYEIESYDPLTGQLVTWVKIPTLSSGTDTTLYLYYDNAVCTNQEDIPGTWDSNFLMVQHLNETYSSASDHYKDSTTHVHDGTLVGGNGENRVSGKIDSALDFDGSNTILTLPESSEFTTPVTATRTYEAWIKLPATPSGYGNILGDYDGPCFQIYTNFLNYFAGNELKSNTITWNADTWYYIVCTVDGIINTSWYNDGINVGFSTENYNLYDMEPDNFWIGANERGEFFRGILDEVRLSTTVRSVAWIQTSYNNQNDPSSFYSIGSEEKRNPILTIIIDPVTGGTIAASPAPPYHYNDVVELTATANTGYSFDHWSGDASGTSLTVYVTMTSDKIVTATFTLLPGYHTLTINIEGQGSVIKDPDQYAFIDGQIVTLTAIPNAGWSFDHWDGDLSGTTNPTTITMNSDATVTATFTQNHYTLTLTTEGQGTVIKNPDQLWYTYGQVITLTASPNAGWSFDHWDGDLSGTTNPTTITMNSDATVTATFTQNHYVLTITINGEGTVIKDPDQPSYTYGQTVTLTATPTTGWFFYYWSGNLTGTANVTSITINANKEVIAIFAQTVIDRTPWFNDSDYKTIFDAGINDNCTVTLNGWTESYVYWQDGTKAAYFNESNKGTGDASIILTTPEGADISDAKGVSCEFKIPWNASNYFAGQLTLVLETASDTFTYGLTSDQGFIETNLTIDGISYLYDTDTNQSFLNFSSHRIFLHFNDITGSLTYGFDQMIYNKTITPRPFTTASVYLNLDDAGHPGIIIDKILTFRDQICPLDDYTNSYYKDFFVAFPPNNYDFGYTPIGHADSMTTNMTIPVLNLFRNYSISVGQTYFYTTDPYMDSLANNASLVTVATSNADLHGIYTHALVDGKHLSHSTVLEYLDDWKNLVGSYPKLWVDHNDNQNDYAINGDNQSSPYYIADLRNESSMKYVWLFYESPMATLPKPPYYIYNAVDTMRAFKDKKVGTVYSYAGMNNLFTSAGNIAKICNIWHSWDRNAICSASYRGLSLDHTYEYYFVYKNISGTKYMLLNPSPPGYSFYPYSMYYNDSKSPWLICPEYKVILDNLTSRLCIYSIFTDQMLDRAVITNGSTVTKNGNTIYVNTPATLVNTTVYTKTNQTGKYLSWGSNYSIFTKGFYSWGATIPSNNGNQSYTLGSWPYYIGDTGQIGRLVFQSNGDVDVHFKRSGSLTIQIPDDNKPSVIYNVTGGGTVPFSYSNGYVTFTGKQGYHYVVNSNYLLTVSMIGSGSVVLDPAGGSYHYETVVTLTATPAAPGWSFDHWSGDASGTSSTTTVTMTDNRAVTAVFVLLSGYYNLTIHMQGQGTVTKDPDQLAYTDGQVVTLEAVPATGWSFNQWSGDLSSTTNPTTITIDSNKTVTANFTINQYTLTVNTIGSGSVDLNPAGGTYNYGTVVTLTAIPHVGWTFTEWSGNLDETLNPTTITMNGNKVITALFNETPSGPWWNLNWPYRKQITIDHAMVLSNLTDFPVLISLNSDDDLKSYAQTNGNDLVFTNKTGTKLSHEIESYNPLIGQLVAWVKVPTLSSTKNTTLYLYFGNGLCSNQEDIIGTWDSNFLMIQHLNETYSTATGHYKDSTTRAHDGTLVGGNGGNHVTGKIGPALNFDGSNTELTLVDSSDFTAPATDMKTYEAWIKFSASPSGYQNILGDYYGPCFLMNGNSLSYFAGNLKNSNTLTWTTDIWYYVVCAVNGATSVSWYRDGISVGSTSNTQNPRDPSNFWIGATQNGGGGADFFNGVIDEVRLSTGVRNSSWIQTSYDNQNDPSSFYSIGNKETRQYYLNIIEVGEGIVITDPDQRSYSYGTIVSLTAAPTKGWAFDHWSGDLSGNTSPATITMNDNKTVTVTYIALEETNYSIPVQNHWNLITIPFNDSVVKVEMRVLYNDIEYTWEEAVSSGIILNDVYDFNRSSGSYMISTLLNPGRGYWMWAYHNCSLTLSSTVAQDTTLASL